LKSCYYSFCFSTLGDCRWFLHWEKTGEHEIGTTTVVTESMQLSSRSEAIYVVHVRVQQEERSVFWEIIVSVILSKKVYMYMCPIPNGFRATAISLYSYKIVDKREILRTVSNTGIYCLSDKVGTVYLV
jgi:hypothetical protein